MPLLWRLIEVFVRHVCKLSKPHLIGDAVLPANRGRDSVGVVDAGNVVEKTGIAFAARVERLTGCVASCRKDLLEVPKSI